MSPLHFSKILTHGDRAMVVMEVGDRVEDTRGQRGTVRYIGPVATSKDASTVYYGVEWDEWGHGLNDGSVTLPSGERVVYFNGPTPRMSKTSPGMPEFKCSFVKQSKLDAEVQRATFLARLLERYDPAAIGGQRLAASVARGRDVVIAGEVGTTMGSQRPIELVGVDKLRTQQTLETIEKISLAQCQITTLGLGSSGELTRLTPRITELDLSFNLFKSWRTVFEFLEELPLLETLILTGNRLVYDDETAPKANGIIKQYPQVKVLVLNQTAIPWQEITTIARRHFPMLTELHIASNEIQDVDLAETDVLNPEAQIDSGNHWVRSLEVLDLSDNALHSWKTIESQIGRPFENIKQLVFNGNQVTTLATSAPATPTHRAFQQLLSLSLNDNVIDSWTSIDALNSYPRLGTLRFMRNPLTAQMGAGEARTLVIARSEHIQVFNASPIRAKERADAEQMYLKRIIHELAAVGESKDKQSSILLCHPRYLQLCERYPEVVASATAALRGGGGGGPSTLGSSLIQVKIVPMSMNATSFDPLAKRMPQNMKISQVKIFVEKKFGVPAAEQLLSFRADSRSMPAQLDDDNCELSYYGLQDGAEILVNDA